MAENNYINCKLCAENTSVRLLIECVLYQWIATGSTRCLSGADQPVGLSMCILYLWAQLADYAKTSVVDL